MPVEHHILQLKFLLMFILMDKRRLKFPLLSYIELLDLYLFGKIHPVLGHSLEYGFLGAPVYGQLLVLLVVMQVLYLISSCKLYRLTQVLILLMWIDSFQNMP